MMRKGGTNGVFWSGKGIELRYYWRLDGNKSKMFKDEAECAMDYITKYVEKYPKYKELVYDKTWNQLFTIFGLTIAQRRQQ